MLGGSKHLPCCPLLTLALPQPLMLLTAMCCIRRNNKDKRRHQCTFTSITYVHYGQMNKVQGILTGNTRVITCML